ncbi:MAG: DUF4097 domain-containing protein [Candidatus Eisenbacteria bacterium]|uniref:DUF4097 domain-containing protein n=1 Tax=Eiseniibacteriota bacterium TaxID=2212470 RepID=A0A538U237_UNCEI|nr:MAG: DUF4097 domain-containing protein [Candidatus Eisenbacteria bacterium]
MKTWLLLILALAVAPQGALADEIWREQSRRVEPAEGLDLVTIDNARGRIDVRPSSDGDLHITALKIARAPTRAEARQIARSLVVELQREGRHYVIRVRYPRESLRVNLWEGFDLSMPHLEMRMMVDVPASMPIELDASSGDLSTQDMRGEQRLRASSGDVSVAGAEGPVDVSTSSGDVSLVDSRDARVGTSSGDVQVSGGARALSIDTSSGDVSIAEASDSIHVATTSGDVTIGHAQRGATVATSSGEVHLRGAAGRLVVHTGSGEIRARVTAPLRDATLTSASGDIRLGLDPDVGCTLEMRTSSGSLDLDVPVRTRTMTRRRVTGVVRDGSAPVRLRSASGNIAVVTGEP